MEFRKFFLRSMSGHVVGVAFLAALFSLLLFGVRRAVLESRESLRDSIALVVFFQPGFPKDSTAWLAQLHVADRQVQKTTYLSPDDALLEAQKDPALAKSLTILQSNPLPASVTVHLADDAWLTRIDPTELMRTLPGIGEIRWDAQARDLFRQLSLWIFFLNRMAVLFACVLGVGVLIGLYRFLALRLELIHFGRQIILGAVGTAFALVAWVVLARPGPANLPISVIASVAWPWVAGVLASIACISAETLYVE